MFKVTVSDKSGQQSKLDFNKPEISIGRMKGNDIVLPKGNVSKRHATIYLRDKSFYVNDHGSTNGTYINGRKVLAEQFVAEGEKIYIGDFILQLDAIAPEALQDMSGLNGRHTLPPNPPDGPAPHPTMFDQMDDLPKDPLRDTYTTMPPDADSGRSDGYPHVPDGLRDTIGPLDELQQVGPPGRKYDAVPYSPNNTQPPAPSKSPSIPPPKPPLEKNIARDPVRPPAITGASPAAPRHHTGGPSTPPAATPATTGPLEPIAAATPSSPLPGHGGQIQLSAAPPEIERDFDAELFGQQVDLIKILAEKFPINEWPVLTEEIDDKAQKRFDKELTASIKTLGPQAKKSKLTDLLTSEFNGLGALGPLLETEEVRDIYINSHDQVLVRQDGKLVQTAHAFSNTEVLELIGKRLLTEHGTPDELVSELRLDHGARLHIVMPPIAAQGPLITVRKPPSSHPTIADLVEQDILSPSMADFLIHAIDAGRSIAIAGPSSSGKTTLLSALAQLIHEGIRIVAVEDFGHICLTQGSAVRLETNTTLGFDKQFLLRQALSMHPQRILLDECRGAEAYDWVTSVASGTEGSLLTIHGVNAGDALGRLESLCLLGAGDQSPRGIREQIARAINIIITVNRTSDGSVRIQQIAEVQGVDLDAFRINDIFYFKTAGTLGSFHPTGYIPMFYEDLRQIDPDVDFGVFQE